MGLGVARADARLRNRDRRGGLLARTGRQAGGRRMAAPHDDAALAELGLAGDRRGRGGDRGAVVPARAVYPDGSCSALTVAGFFLRLRPPREPRRVFFFTGASPDASSADASTAAASPDSSPLPRSTGGRWIRGAAPSPGAVSLATSSSSSAPSATAPSATPLSAAAGFFFRLRPPRVPRRVRFFGGVSPAGCSSVATASSSGTSASGASTSASASSSTSASASASTSASASASASASSSTSASG